MVPFVDGVAYGLLLFVVAAGLMLAFAVGGVLNLAHGVVFAFGAYLCATVSDGSWAATGLAVIIGTAAGAGGAGLRAAGGGTWPGPCPPGASRSSGRICCARGSAPTICQPPCPHRSRAAPTSWATPTPRTGSPSSSPASCSRSLAGGC